MEQRLPLLQQPYLYLLVKHKVRDENSVGLLSSHRFLDLCDEEGIVCGHILGDLGACLGLLILPTRRGYSLDIELADSNEILLQI